MCWIVWFSMEKYTKFRMIIECACTKERGMGASNVLSLIEVENILFTTDETHLGHVLVKASNSYSNVHKKFRETKIIIYIK